VHRCARSRLVGPTFLTNSRTRSFVITRVETIAFQPKSGSSAITSGETSASANLLLTHRVRRFEHGGFIHARSFVITNVDAILFQPKIWDVRDHKRRNVCVIVHWIRIDRVSAPTPAWLRAGARDLDAHSWLESVHKGRSQTCLAMLSRYILIVSFERRNEYATQRSTRRL
jgi:hypothetical protein